MGVAFVADGEAAVAAEPGDGAFDLPAVAAEAFAGVDAAAGDAGGDAAFAQPSAVAGGVVALVGAEFAGPAAARSAAGPDRGDAGDQWLQRLPVVGVRGGDADDQGQAVRVGQDMDLRSGFAAVDGVRAGQRAPLFARRLAASMIALDQSMSPAAP